MSAPLSDEQRQAIEADPEFVTGLESILSQLDPSTVDVDSVKQQALQFFAAQKTKTTSESLPAAATEQPPYPLSFNELAELIASGKPIPGIKEIPDKLSDEPPSESKLESVKKPWE